MVPRENKNNPYAKFDGNKQRILWYFPKWPVDISKGECTLSVRWPFCFVWITHTIDSETANQSVFLKHQDH